MLELFKRIRSRREGLGISQDELAKRVGYKSRSSINKIEMGKNDITQSKIMEIAKALNTTPEYLMGWVPTPEKPLTKDEVIMLNGYRALNAERQQLVRGMISQFNEPVNTTKEQFNNSGEINNNFVAYGGRNSVNQNVTMEKR